MKISKRLLALLLAGLMVVSATACGKKDDAAATLERPTANDTEIYEAQLDDFNSVYEEAVALTAAEQKSEKWAQMAIAEAKLMQSATVVPLYADGGRYGMTRKAPYTSDYALWGSDEYRYDRALVCNEIIKAEDYSAMKAKWGELRGTGTYADFVKTYLADHGYTLKDEFVITYNSEIETFDMFTSQHSTTAEVIVNTYSGLVEYDGEGNLNGALAESWEPSEDLMKYTFKLREGVMWVDSQGREIAEVCADDFVAGMQHMIDAGGGFDYYVDGLIENATEYINGDITDFSQVGVKALDKYTVEYTLAKPSTYFTTMLTYTTFAPLCRTYYESLGGKFGAEYDPAASDYTYGTSPETIAYCGAYLITNRTENNTYVYEANPTFWNKDNQTIKKITWLYNDGSDPTKAYNDFLAGTIDSCGVNENVLEVAKNDGNFDKYAYVGDTTATTYTIFFNVDREAYANASDATAVVSAQTEDDQVRTAWAMQNVHFRRAIAFSIDKVTYNEQLVGSDLKELSTRNTYTPWNLVSLEEEVTVDINGEATTFPAGTFYAEIMQAQLEADGSTIVAFNPDVNDGVGSGDGYDGWYNVDAAVEELKIAIDELKEQGVVIDAENPIYVDLPYPSNVELYSNRANAIKQSVEAALGEYGVVVSLVECADTDEWLYTGYYINDGTEANYDLFDLSGWGPDYGDPATFLETMIPGGYSNMCVGL